MRNDNEAIINLGQKIVVIINVHFLVPTPYMLNLIHINVRGDYMMKAVEVIGYGDINQLKVVEKEIPEPKEDEVLIKVKACGINNTEIWMREGAYGADTKSGWREEGV